MSSPKAFTISPSDLKSPTDCVTLITGASSGIGLQTALLLHTLSPNNSLILLDLHPIAPQNVSAAFITSPRILFLQSDITSWPSQREAFEKGIQRFGKIDNVFVNAGIAEYGDQFFKDEVDGEGRLREPDRRVVDVDLQAAGDTVKLAVHYLRRNRERGGSVVLTASLAGYLASAGAPVYSAAKHGIVGLMRALKNDTATLNIAISVVAPGITLTDLVSGRDTGESLSDWAERMRGLGVPINSPVEVAATVVWLMGLGMGANGKGMLVQAGKVADVEEGLARSRKAWMGEEMLELFREGRTAPLFPNKL